MTNAAAQGSVKSNKIDYKLQAQQYVTAAKRFYMEGELGRAIKMLRHAVKLVPGRADWQTMLGSYLVKEKRHAEAAGPLEKALTIDPNQVQALTELGSLYTNNNRLKEAEPHLLRALQLKPDAAMINVVYGVFLQKQGQFPEAIRYLRKGLAEQLDQLPKPLPKPAKKKDFDQPETEQLLWDTLSQFAKAGVHGFAAFGTLLGLTREGHLLPFDKDLDFGLPFSELERACRCLEANGWYEPNLMAGISNPRSLVHRKTGITTDLSGFTVDAKTGQVYESFFLKGAPYEWVRHTVFPSITLKKSQSPMGEPIWAIDQPEAWLETLYGDWKTPDPYFDTIIAAKNQVGFSLMTQCYALSRIYQHRQSGRVRKALATAEHTLRHLPGDELIERAVAQLKAIVDELGEGEG